MLNLHVYLCIFYLFRENEKRKVLFVFEFGIFGIKCLLIKDYVDLKKPLYFTIRQICTSYVYKFRWRNKDYDFRKIKEIYILQQLYYSYDQWEMEWILKQISADFSRSADWLCPFDCLLVQPSMSRDTRHSVTIFGPKIFLNVFLQIHSQTIFKESLGNI